MKQENGMKMYILEAKRIGKATTNDVGHSVGGNEATEFNEKMKLPKSMDINVAHGLCHLGEKLLRVTFSSMGIRLTGKLNACTAAPKPNICLSYIGCLIFHVLGVLKYSILWVKLTYIGTQYM